MRQRQDVLAPRPSHQPPELYVDFPNDDPIFHNARFSSYSGEIFDLGTSTPPAPRP